MPKQAELTILSTKENKEPYFTLSKTQSFFQKTKHTTIVQELHHQRTWYYTSSYDIDI